MTDEQLADEVVGYMILDTVHGVSVWLDVMAEKPDPDPAAAQSWATDLDGELTGHWLYILTRCTDNDLCLIAVPLDCSATAKRIPATQDALGRLRVAVEQQEQEQEQIA